MSGEERRKHPRITKEVLLRYRRVAPERDPVSAVGILCEISRGGLKMRAKRECAAGAILEIRIPETDITDPRKVNAQVVSCRPAEQDGEFYLGCRFVRLPEQAEA